MEKGSHDLQCESLNPKTGFSQFQNLMYTISSFPLEYTCYFLLVSSRYFGAVLQWLAVYSYQIQHYLTKSSEANGEQKRGRWFGLFPAKSVPFLSVFLNELCSMCHRQRQSRNWGRRPPCKHRSRDWEAGEMKNWIINADILFKCHCILADLMNTRLPSQAKCFRVYSIVWHFQFWPVRLRWDGLKSP